jgi:MFS transporter, DHA2 family, multidrug resistance protein
MATTLAPTAGAAPRGSAAAGKWTVAFAVLVGALMSAIDTSIVNVALVHIQATFGVNTQEVTWVSAAYLISVVIVMPLTGWLSETLGRKTLYLGAITLFTVASALCGLSRSLGQLILFRVIQGVGGGVLQPVAQAIVREGFPPEQQGQAMAFYGLIVLLGPAVGPVLGGWLTDNFEWPWIFFVNLPVGPLALYLTNRFVQDPPYMRRRGGVRVDVIGIALLAVGLAALQTVLEEGERDAWFQSSFIAVTAAIAALALIGFVLWELQTPTPAADLRILKNLSFASATFIAGIIGVGLFGGLILLPQFLQGPLQYPATQAGLWMMPYAIAMLGIMPIAGALYSRLGVHAMMAIGLALAGLAGWLMAHYTLDTGPVQLVIAQVIQGAGLAFIYVSISTAALATIPTRLMQGATGLFNLIRQLGGSIGTTGIITLLDYKKTTASARLVHYANIYSPVFQQWVHNFQEGFLARGADPFTAHQRALAVLQGLIYQQATVVAFEYDFAMLGLLFIVCIPLLVFIRRGASQPEGHAIEI